MLFYDNSNDIMQYDKNQVKGENKETKIKIENGLKVDSTNVKTNTNF